MVAVILLALSDNAVPADEDWVTTPAPIVAISGARSTDPVAAISSRVPVITDSGAARAGVAANSATASKVFIRGSSNIVGGLSQRCAGPWLNGD
jgi:hypothetical protein